MGTSDSKKGRLSRSRGVRVSEGIRIERNVEDVFDFFRAQWVIKGPGGVPLGRDAEIVTEQRPQLLAWKSTGSADVVNAGSVKFTSLGADATDVEVRLQYDPPAGKSGAEVLRDALQRVKQLLESDEWRPGVEAAQMWLHGRGEV